MVSRAIILANRLVIEGGGKVSPRAVALIRRSLTALSRIGVQEVCVVDGEQADILRDRLALHEFPQLDVQVLSNRSWQRAAGASLLVARDFLAGSGDDGCLVLPGERTLDPEALAALASVELDPEQGYAAAIVVSTCPDAKGVALSTEAKVTLDSVRGGYPAVSDIGLDMESYDAVFTGHAVVTKSILPVLNGMLNPTLENGLWQLLKRGRVCAVSGSVEGPWSRSKSVEVEDKVAALLDSKQHPQYTLMNPGPVTTTSTVKSALVHHDMSHRDSSFSELIVSLTGRLRRIYKASHDHTVVMVTGSGTAAMECAISSSVPRDGKILVVDNGAFGERMLEVARLHELDVVHLRYAWGDTVDPADIERAFEEHPGIAVVAMVHHETSVGLLNPVTQVGAICRRFDALFIVDAVSSLGAEDLDVVRDNIDLCYGSANKCLHAISGTGFLCVSPRTWKRIENIKARSYYLDLKRYRRYMDDLAQTPFTPAVSSYFALDAACSEFLADGHTKRLDSYKALNRHLRDGMARLGMAPFTRTGKESHSVVVACVPRGVTFQELYDRLKLRGYIVYGCKDVLADKFLQVANMGNLGHAQIDEFLRLATEVIAEIRAESAVLPQVVPVRARVSA